MSSNALWRELPLTRATLQDRGLKVLGVWTMDIGIRSHQRVYVDWQQEPNQHEFQLAKHLVFARRIIDILPGDEKPWLAQL